MQHQLGFASLLPINSTIAVKKCNLTAELQHACPGDLHRQLVYHQQQFCSALGFWPAFAQISLCWGISSPWLHAL